MTTEQTSCATRVSPRGPSLALRAIHLVSRLRRAADMCSSTESGTAQRSRNGSTLCSPAVIKILCCSPFSKRSPVSDLRQTNKQKEVGVKRVETLVSTLLPRRRVRRLPAKDWRPFLNLQRTEKAKNPLAFASGLTGAADEARTRYLHLGKVALYQMSYSRICDFEKKRWSG